MMRPLLKVTIKAIILTPAILTFGRPIEGIAGREPAPISALHAVACFAGASLFSIVGGGHWTRGGVRAAGLLLAVMADRIERELADPASLLLQICGVFCLGAVIDLAFGRLDR